MFQKTVLGCHGLSYATAGQGIYGQGEPGRGGIFKSMRDPEGPIAQVQLIPQMFPLGQRPQPLVPVNPNALLETPDLQRALPKDGRTGDLFALEILNDEARVRFGTLWFCFQGAREGSQALWSQVLMGPPVTGKG